MVLVCLRRQRFPKGTYHKLNSQKFRPYKVLKKISLDAYLIKLSSDLQIRSIFNAPNLFSYEGFNRKEIPTEV